MKFDIPYLKMRGGRPRWEPGPGLRNAGFRGQDLRDGDGVWLDEQGAIAKARELNAGVAAWRREGAPRRKPRTPTVDTNTCRALWEQYQKSPYFARLRASSQGDYRRKAEIFLATFGDAPVAAVSKSLMLRWYQKMFEERGHAMANATVAIARRILSHGEDLELIAVNPAKRIRMIGVEARAVLWEPAEIDALIAAADGNGLPSIGDAVVIALHSGQRQGDILALRLEGVERGRVQLRQSKTRQRVSIPISSALEQRLDAIRRRRSAGDLVDLAQARRVVLDEAGRDYTTSSFGKAWRRVRRLAARAAERPEIEAKLFLDLRDTAITRMALADCSLAEICAVSGHDLKTVTEILKHYLVLNEDMADSAGAKMTAWRAREGLTI